MNREQLAHILRAASQIADETDVVVIGSQAILGSYDESQLPEEAIGSIEVDVTFFDDLDATKSDKVDGAIGELSRFHEMNNYYAQGVSIATATLPNDWEDRLVLFEDLSSQPGRGLCLEPHDLVASKLAAGRGKDFQFAEALLRGGLVDYDTLIKRLGTLPIEAERIKTLFVWVEARR